MLGAKVHKEMKKAYAFSIANSKNFFVRIATQSIIYNLASMEELIKLKKPTYPSDARFSFDDKYVAIKNTSGSTVVYEVSTFREINRFNSKKNFKLSDGGFSWVTGKYEILDIVNINNRYQIIHFDILNDNKKLITDFKLDLNVINYNDYIISKDQYLFSHRNVDELDEWQNEILKLQICNGVYNVQTIKFTECKMWNALLYNTKFNFYVIVDEDYTIFLIDENDVVHNKIHIFKEDKYEYFVQMTISNCESYLVVVFCDSVDIYELPSLKLIRTERIDNASYVAFSKNDEYMLLGTSEKGYILENNL